MKILIKYLDMRLSQLRSTEGLVTICLFLIVIAFVLWTQELIPVLITILTWTSGLVFASLISDALIRIFKHKRKWTDTQKGSLYLNILLFVLLIPITNLD
jgi:hypothetical protein